MALAFRSVFVTVGVNSDGVTFDQFADFGPKDKVRVRTADCAIKSFNIGFRQDDHNFFFERIAVHNVRVANNLVVFDVFALLRDDTDDPNKFRAEVEVLVIADVEERHP